MRQITPTAPKLQPIALFLNCATDEACAFILRVSNRFCKRHAAVIYSFVNISQLVTPIPALLRQIRH